MRQSGPKFHIDYHDFTLEVHVIGYRTKGESIVVLFKEGQRTFYSMVIDCYGKKKGRATINKTTDILVRNGVTSLPMIIMTHPHEDHINGIKSLIDKFCDDKTMFYSSTHSFDINNQTVKLTKQEVKLLRLVRAINEKKKTFSNVIGVSSEGHVSLRNIYLYDNIDCDEQNPIIIEVNALTPITSINDAKRINKDLDPNDLSIAIILCICDYYFLFGADMTDDHIDYLDSETMSAVRFLKIPHHASDTSSHLVHFFLRDQLDYACSTSYHIGRSHLPLKTILQQYSAVSKRVDVLGCKSDDKRKGAFGEICYQFTLGPYDMLSQVQYEGVVRRVH